MGRALLILALAAAPLAAADSLYLELSARGERIDLGVAAVQVTGASAGDEAEEIRRTLRADLEFAGTFTLVEGGPVPDKRGGGLDAWARLGADLVAAGEVGAGVLSSRRFDGYLYDALSGRRVLAKTFSMSEGPRRAAHLWADEIVRYFTGQPGVAASRIVFVNDGTGKKEVCLVDADGGNFTRLTDDRSIALFPKFSPDGRWIAYTTFREGRPAIYLMRHDGRERRALCRYDGLNSAASWTPDGRGLVATLSLGGIPSLHLVDLQGRVVQTLTRSAAADTAPTLSPDGGRLAFTSDRPGPPQIYTMEMTGADLRRMTREGQCDSPHWSPLGHQIVFTLSLGRGRFDLWTLEVATGRTDRLTFGEGDNENPSFSPDGRHIVFTSTRRGRPELWVMGADGSRPRPLAALPGKSFTPHWGP